jgi:PRTRC genetic system ThiF family protein
MTAHFDPNMYLRHITLVGCGGTGSLLARFIARMLWDMKQRRMHLPDVTFIDFDKIEEQNCSRQLFVSQEIGQFKSQILMRRYNLAFGLEISAITAPVDAEKHFPHSGIVIDAVDNHEARRELAKLSDRHVIVACGNSSTNGQVSIGNVSDRERALQAVSNLGERVYSLPTAYALFPELLEPEVEIEPVDTPFSCSERINRGSQHLLINDTVAMSAAIYLYRILHRQPIESFLTFIGIDPILTIRSLLIQRSELLAYLKPAG